MSPALLYVTLGSSSAIHCFSSLSFVNEHLATDSGGCVYDWSSRDTILLLAPRKRLYPGWSHIFLTEPSSFLSIIEHRQM